jgi:hypothetical protein
VAGATGEPASPFRCLLEEIGSGDDCSEVPMSKLRATVRAAGIAALLGLSACSGPPWVLAKSEHDISLRWYSDNTPSAAADQVAELHCASWGKSAELASAIKDGSAQIAQYRCR